MVACVLTVYYWNNIVIDTMTPYCRFPSYAYDDDEFVDTTQEMMDMVMDDDEVLLENNESAWFRFLHMLQRVWASLRRS